MKKIVLTGGGTAGHVTPNLALIPHLKELDYEISYIGSYDGIELCDWNIRVKFQESLKVRVRTAYTAGFVNLEMNRRGTGLETNFPWEINVPGGKGTGINEPVNRPFTNHKRILVVFEYMVGRLSLSDQWGNDLLYSQEFFFRQGKT